MNDINMFNKRIADFSLWLKENNLDAWLLKANDPYLNEDRAERWEILQYISNFSGSAGEALIFANPQKDGSFGFVLSDSRYHQQLRMQLKGVNLTAGEIEKNTAIDIAIKLENIEKLGFDPFTVSKAYVDSWEKKIKLAGKAINLTIVPSSDPFEKLWVGRPEYRNTKITKHPLEYAGVDVPSKLSALKKELKANNADAYLIADTPSIAWLTNARGQDVSCNTIFLSYGIVDSEGVLSLFIDQDRVPNDVQETWGNKVAIVSPDKITDSLKQLSSANKTVLYDPSSTPCGLTSLIKHPLTAIGLVAKMKAIKNPSEIAGMKDAILRDSIFFAKTFAHMDNFEYENDVERFLVAERKKSNEYIYDSFSAICASGGNAAMAHYRSSQDKETPIKKNAIFLLDSGGQYIDGTTDMTRSCWVGEKAPPKELITIYTAVLAGVIDVSSLTFPKGTTGAVIDASSRKTLWSIGKNFQHGCGHGIGASLAVHEGPYSLSSNCQLPMQEGNLQTIEPGSYEEDKYGIRLENIALIEKSSKEGFLQFKTFSYCPFDLRLVDAKMLNANQLDWFNAYNKACYSKLLPFMDSDKEKAWLSENTKTLS